MGLEVAEFVSQLSVLDPRGDDFKNQGDDHIRLIKRVLQNTFPSANRAFRSRDWTTVFANYSAVAADDNKTILCNPGAAMIMTLPSPAPYAGWSVRVMRAATTPVVLVQPSAGNINGLARARVAVPYEESVFVWSGSEYYRVKSAGEPPPGAILWSPSSTIPLGYAAANGQALAVVDCPELNAAWGFAYGGSGGSFNCPNVQNRFVVAAGSSYAVGAIGGEDFHVLSLNEMPKHKFSGTTAINGQNHDHDATTAAGKNGLISTIGGAGWYGEVGTVTGTQRQNHTHGFETNELGMDWGHENRPSYIAMNPIFRLC